MKMERTNDINVENSQHETLEERFNKERLEWNAKIKDMSSKLKRFVEIPELMTTLYTERQTALEYYHYLMSLLINVNKKYKTQFTEKYDFYTTKSQIRYPNETMKQNKIQSDLIDLVQKREILENHAKFMLGVKESVDQIVWAVSKRIDAEKILRGD